MIYFLTIFEKFFDMNIFFLVVILLIKSQRWKEVKVIILQVKIYGNSNKVREMKHINGSNLR